MVMDQAACSYALAGNNEPKVKKYPNIFKLPK
jgi:hypothetical protein